mmetsp:Transcript_18875/g.39575  ORF Transcript_18875/g.39575 Transcript_18875/m.39575 type:complete len:102 (+) Transcript_18875:449-754(+)
MSAPPMTTVSVGNSVMALPRTTVDLSRQGCIQILLLALSPDVEQTRFRLARFVAKNANSFAALLARFVMVCCRIIAAQSTLKCPKSDKIMKFGEPRKTRKC